MNIRTVLVFAPHADDETLGLSGTLLKLISQGARIHIVVCTNASVAAPEIFSSENIDEVRSECTRASSFMGVESLRFLDFPAPALDCFPVFKVASEFSKIINNIRPDTVFLPFPYDLHLDHFAIHRAGLVAARPSSSSVKNILLYETLSETEYGSKVNNIFRPQFYVDVSDFINKKISTFEFYKSQIQLPPGNRNSSSIKSLASYRGLECGVQFAECFMIERVTI